MKKIRLPRHEEVFAELLNDIQNGKYAAGQKLPSEAVLGKRFQTSRITIGRALRELKQRGLVEGVAGSGNFVKPTVESGDALLFGLLIPNLGETEIFEPICQGIANAREAGTYALLWGHIAEQESIETQALQLCEQYISRKVAGVFFAPLELTPNSAEINLKIGNLFREAGIPIVLLDRCILPFPQRSSYDLVGIDNRRAAYMATEHLIRLGAKDVAFLALTGGAPTVEARLAGYREALVRNNIAFEPDRVQRLESITAAGVRRAIENARSTAFLCSNDYIAGQLLQALQELSLSVPNDIRVVGIDDVDYAGLLAVPLTTIHQPCREIGQAAMNTMLSRLNKPDMLPRDVLIDCRLVVRESCGAKRRPKPD